MKTANADKKGLFVIFAMIFTCACGARPNVSTPLSAVSGEMVDVWVTNDSGETLSLFEVENRHYLLGQLDVRYQIWLANNSDSRVEAVVSVDGLDVITGQTADYRNVRGYVIDPGGQVSIDGFRQSLDEVAAFQFSYREESYAAQMGDGSNTGVIGVAVFEEEPVQKSAPLVIADEARAPNAAQEEAKMGTRYGETTTSQAQFVPFKRKFPDQPSQIVALFYDDKIGLESVGVVFADEPLSQPNPDPDPFPANNSSHKFAPPPSAR